MRNQSVATLPKKSESFSLSGYRLPAPLQLEVGPHELLPSPFHSFGHLCLMRVLCREPQLLGVQKRNNHALPRRQYPTALLSILCLLHSLQILSHSVSWWGADKDVPLRARDSNTECLKFQYKIAERKYTKKTTVRKEDSY